MGRRAAREEKKEVNITFVCTACNKDSFAYLSKVP